MNDTWVFSVEVHGRMSIVVVHRGKGMSWGHILFCKIDAIGFICDPPLADRVTLHDAPLVHPEIRYLAHHSRRYRLRTAIFTHAKKILCQLSPFDSHHTWNAFNSMAPPGIASGVSLNHRMHQEWPLHFTPPRSPNPHRPRHRCLDSQYWVEHRQLETHVSRRW